MKIEKIEQAFGLVVENIEAIQAELATDFYDAFVEQNSYFLDEALLTLPNVKSNNQLLRELSLTKNEWQKLFQFVLLKGSQVAPLQPNHAFTPDSIAVIFQFMIECLKGKSELCLLEFGSGTGNLAEVLLCNLSKSVKYVGFEADDLLLDLAASMAEIIGTNPVFMQVDAVQSRLVEPVDVVISDLPIGFYPDDVLAANFSVANLEGHTFAHHLLIEQALKYLKADGLAIFLAPEDLLTSSQAPLLKKWLTQGAHVAAVITLPEKLFKHDAKAIFVLGKGNSEQPTFVYPLTSLTDRDVLQEFMNEFRENCIL